MRPIKACNIVTNLWLFVHALSFLNAEHEARKQHVPFFKAFGVIGWDPNHRPPRIKAAILTIMPSSLVVFRSFIHL